MYHVSAQGVDERMINVHFIYIYINPQVTQFHKTNPGTNLKQIYKYQTQTFGVSK